MFSILIYGRQINEAIDDTTTVFSPRLTLEMGKAGALEFGVPASHFIYGQLFPLVTVITVEYDGREIFRGRILSSERGFNNSRKIYCEGNLAYLVDSQIMGEKYEGNTHDLFRRIVAKHNARVEAQKQFAVGIISIENRPVILTGQSDQTEDPDTGEIDYKQIAINAITDTWKTSFDYIETCLIDYCGGYLRTRRVGDTTYLDLVTDYGSTSAQEIEFGINLLDLVEGDSADEIFTVLIPLGDDNLDISSVNNGSDELVDAAGVAKYGRIVKTHVFSNVNQASTLLENGQRFLANEQNIPNTFTVKAVDFHLIDSSVGAIFVGDRVHVNSAPHGVSEYMTCTKIEYDLENPENNTYTFGSPHQTLTERYRKDKQKSSDGASGAGATGQSTKDEIDRIYNAYIDIDPDTAHITLKALYTILQQEVGIELNGVTGNVNIKSMKNLVDENQNRIGEVSAHIDVVADENRSKIELLTGWHQTLEGVEQGHYAELILKADELQSSINMKADNVTVEGIETTLKGRLDGVDTTLLLKASKEDLEETEGRVGTLETAQAELSASVGDLDAKLALKANSQSVTMLNNDVRAVEEAQAILSARVSDSEAKLELKADSTTVSKLSGLVTEVRSSTASLSSRVGSAESRLDLTATSKSVTDLSGRVSTVETSTATLSADTIALKAFQTKVEGKMTVGNVTTFAENVNIRDALDVNGNVDIGGYLHVGTSITIAGHYYEPTSITSTSGEKIVLGTA